MQSVSNTKIRILVLLRHGQSLGNVWEHFYNSDHTNFLSLNGIMQSVKAGLFMNDHNLSFDKVVSSEMSRARLTASIVSQVMGDHLKRDEHIIIDERLNERGFKHRPIEFPDKRWDEIESKETHWNRVKLYIQYELADMIGKENVLVVSHGITMNVLLAELCPDFIDLDYDKHVENAYPYMLVYHDEVLVDVFGGRLAKKKWPNGLPTEEEVFATEFWTDQDQGN